ncbi:MAG: chromosomal replication initiator protein DnaA [Dehalococcoidales bacterium]|nr:MAG: chromosomal replication initiator protein DnaA [Dehalococcoidales bacterium]
MSVRSAQQIWETALGELQIEVNRSNYRTWLRGTVGLSFYNGDFVVGVPNAFVAEYLEKNLRSLIEKVLTGLAQSKVKVDFHIGTREEGPKSQHKNLPLFNPKYTFDSFIVGKSNEMAHAAALKVAEQPGQTYNPLFIHGPAGLGKTHLLHAIGHAAMANGLNTLYVSAEQFTNEVVSAIRDGRTEEFRKKYRSVDMLLVDDIQFFGGKERTRENFFHTFNDLYAANRQITVTSDCPPREIPQIRAQLRSRLEWGLVTDLLPPDFETRLAILQAKAAHDRIDITPDVLEFIALQIKENIRALEGSLNRVVAYSKLLRTMVTPESAARALEDIASKKPEPAPLPPALIAEATATSFQITLSDLKGRKRDEATVLARQVTMYLMRQETDCSLSRIGQELGGRSPATISYAYEKIANSINNDPHLRRQVFNIQQKLHAAI